MRNEQELFDHVVKHLRQQGQQSMATPEWDGHIRCMYRSSEGLKCSIGCFINDADYKPEMEGQRFDKLLEAKLLPELLQQEFEPHQKLLLELQMAHDLTSPLEWEYRLETIATNFKLIYKAP